MTAPIFLVDAFTGAAFGGNPAGVCLLGEARDAEWMQAVGREMSQAETAFVRAIGEGFELRWFTPTVEVDLCGHATLASAHVLWETGRLAPGDIARFHTRSGLLTACRRDGWIELDFPATPETPAETPPGLADALGVTPRYVGKSRFDYLVEVDDEAAVRAVRPDFDRLSAVPARGVMVTSRSTMPGVDFVSRFFAPQSGVNEDAATGSSHCCLAPFWSPRLQKTTFLAHQLSARIGVLKVELAGDRVRLRGQAVTTVRGEMIA